MLQGLNGADSLGRVKREQLFKQFETVVIKVLTVLDDAPQVLLFMLGPSDLDKAF